MNLRSCDLIMPEKGFEVGQKNYCNDIVPRNLNLGRFQQFLFATKILLDKVTFFLPKLFCSLYSKIQLKIVKLTSIGVSVFPKDKMFFT